MDNAPVVICVDPGLLKPEIEVYGLLQNLLDQLPGTSVSLKVCAPVFKQHTFLSFLIEHKINAQSLVAVVGLGSLAHVTEDLPWVNQLADEMFGFLKTHHIPFFGICFSHQLMAHWLGCKVDYLKDKSIEKHHEFRRIDVHAGRFSQFLCDDESQVPGHTHFTAHARHSQEVHTLSSELRCEGSSPQCAIDVLSHSSLPWFSVQTHVETPHISGMGWKILKNFLYFSLVTQNKKVTL